jgi:hypothetical protein
MRHEAPGTGLNHCGRLYACVMPSLYEFASGDEALHRPEDTFSSIVLRDPLLQPLFGAGKPEHVDHLPPSPPSPSVASIGSPGTWASLV